MTRMADWLEKWPVEDMRISEVRGQGVGFERWDRSLSIQRVCWLLIMFLIAPLQRAFRIIPGMSSIKLCLHFYI